MTKSCGVPRVLVVDDERGPRESLRLILEPAYEVQTAENGMEALAQLDQTGADVVTLDLVMPGLRGSELMRTIRAQHSETEVIVITGSSALDSARAAIRYGVADYLEKPFDVVQVTAAVERAIDRRRSRGRLLRFLNGLAGELGLTGDPFSLAKDHDWTARLGALLSDGEPNSPTASFGAASLEFFEVLAETIEAKDRYMRGHAQRVSFYARLLAHRIGLDREELEHVRIASFLHDVGKVSMPSQLLLRPGPLDSAEREILEQHPEIGERLVEPLGVPTPVLAAIRHHHESWDGSGYPDGLRSAEIPHLARVIQVADAFDAMTSDRPYRKARSQEVARLELRRFAGIQFDPELAFEFDAVLDEGACEIDGTLVTEIAALDSAQRAPGTAWAREGH
jgi:response regulator RpfG family c-di-GMP phosphodiesterase